MRRTIRNNRGTITVEACLTFPVFICFFLLLVFFIKVACINITLNHAVNETTKQLAAASYPVGLLNELEDEKFLKASVEGLPDFGKELENIGGYVTDSAKELLPSLLSGNMSHEDINSAAASIAGSIGTDIGNGLKGLIVKNFAGKYYELKTKAKYASATYLMDKLCEGSFVNLNSLKYVFVELPQSDLEYDYKNNNAEYNELYKKLGFLPGRDDVIVAVEYNYKISLPFFSRNITMRHVAVEKAWIHGSNGTYSEDYGSPDEKNSEKNDGSGSDDIKDSRGEVVYVTKTGDRYHNDGCMYLSKSKIPISLTDARDKSYIPCKVCVTKTAKPLRNHTARDSSSARELD